MKMIIPRTRKSQALFGHLERLKIEILIKILSIMPWVLVLPGINMILELMTTNLRSNSEEEMIRVMMKI